MSHPNSANQPPDAIFPGFTVDQEKFEALYLEKTGKAITLDPKVFQTSVCGSRILILRDEADSKAGSIIVPESVKSKNPPGAGWVIAVGDMVGQATGPHPHGVSSQHPANLLYKHIIFGMFACNEFVTRSYIDGGFNTQFFMITDRDVWMIDESV